MKIEWVEQCKSCKGTGLYVGTDEREGAAVVCWTCKGTGRFEGHIEYEEFTGRVKAEKSVSRVYKTGVGLVLAPQVTSGGVPLQEWEQDSDSVNRRGTEVRSHTCPAWWYQAADYDRKPNWNECLLVGQFSNCLHFKNKAACWARFDEEEQAKEAEA